MSEMSHRSHFTPDGWHTVTPRIVVHEARQLVKFVKQVFGAKGDYRSDVPTVLRIGDSNVMISDAGIRNPTPAFLYVYVENTDETYRRAVEAGARARRCDHADGTGEHDAVDHRRGGQQQGRFRALDDELEHASA